MMHKWENWTRLHSKADQSQGQNVTQGYLNTEITERSCPWEMNLSSEVKHSGFPKNRGRKSYSGYTLVTWELQKTIQQAKDSVFLPGIQNTLKNTLNCSVCLTYKDTVCLTNKDSNAKEQMIPTEFPDIPYQTICADQYQQLVASSLL